jgi:hypothetical protein
MRGDCQKLRPIRRELILPWVSFWKDGDLRSLANFLFHLSPEIVKQFNILQISKNKEEKSSTRIIWSSLFVQRQRNVNESMY